MKVKIIMGTGEKELERKVNDFIAQPNIKISDIKALDMIQSHRTIARKIL